MKRARRVMRDIFTMVMKFIKKNILSLEGSNTFGIDLIITLLNLGYFIIGLSLNMSMRRYLLKLRIFSTSTKKLKSKGSFLCLIIDLLMYPFMMKMKKMNWVMSILIQERVMRK